MDQQFRLKWNNHCNTLLQVFGNLLKTETLVDCTIGADGQYLKAHKVVVSACSPYFQSLFTEHFDKHPIIILKDIKFAELQSMIDYMYEGEVNISQDQLPSFLKAAASIQLKGLTQNVKPEGQEPPKPVPQLNNAPPPRMLSNGSLTPSSMLNVELEEGQKNKRRKMGEPHREHSSASSSPSLVPDLVVPNVILDVPGENNGSGAAGGPQNGQGEAGHMKKEPSEYSGRSEDEEEDGMSHDGWDLSNDGLHDSNSLNASDRGPSQMHHGGPPGANRAPGGGPNPALSGPDTSNVDENNQGSFRFTRRKSKHPYHNIPRSLGHFHTFSQSEHQGTGFDKSARSKDGTKEDTIEFSKGKITRSIQTDVEILTSVDADGLGETAKNQRKPKEQYSNPWLQEYISKFQEFKQEFNEVSESMPKAIEQSTPLFSIQNKIKKEHHELKSGMESLSNKGDSKHDDFSNNNTSPGVMTPEKQRDSTTTDFSPDTSKYTNAFDTVDVDSSMSAFMKMLNNLKPNKIDNPNVKASKMFYEPEKAGGKNSMVVSRKDPHWGHMEQGSSRGGFSDTGGPSAVKGSNIVLGSHIEGIQGYKGDNVDVFGRNQTPAPSKSGNDAPKSSAYKCHKCGNSYARLHSLSRHVKFECGVAPKFECFICHKRSKHKHNLLLHMKTHTMHK